MRRRSFSWLVVLGLCAGTVWAQGNFVYTNNDTIPNTVSGFAVGEDGVLTEVSGSPFLTGGNGRLEGDPGFYAANRIRVVENFLYASNARSNSVSGFSIDPDTGILTPVPGSPFPTGGLNSFGISLAITLDGTFLYAGNNFSRNITVFSIGPDGGLRAVSSLVPAGDGINGMVVSANGKWLAAALSYEGPHGAVAMFSIDSRTGEIIPVPGSPFALRDSGDPDGGASGLDMNCASDALFVGEGRYPGTTIVDVFRIDLETGTLTPIEGSPFMPGVGENSNVPLLSPDDTLLFVSNQFSNSVTVFTVDEEGSLTLVPGSPFHAGATSAPSGIATDAEGKFVFVAKVFPDGVTVFTVGGGGVLSLVPGSPFPTGTRDTLLSLTAYPPKTCSVPK